jgi:hypothetical protein
MAYGVNAPFGLQPRRMITGAPWNGQMNEYPIADSYNASLYTGDPVGVNANGTITLPAASAVLGVFMGCTYVNTSGVLVTSAYWPANTATFQAQGAKALVVDDPNVLFDIQVSDNRNGQISGIQAADINNNFAFNVANGGGVNANPAAGSPVTGQSAYYLDYQSINTTATLSLKAMALTPYPGNIFATAAPAVIGVGAYNNVLVILNNHILKGGTGTAGV